MATAEEAPTRGAGKGSSSPLLTVLTVGVAACFVTANVVAVKLISVLGHTLPGGVIVYPLAFLLDDVIVEVYGYSAVRRAIWLGFAANAIFVGAALAVLHLPASGVWKGQQAYAAVLGYSWRLLAGAFASYLCSSFANAQVMARMKALTRGRALWSRTIASTIVGQFVDSSVFVAVAYSSILGWRAERTLILTLWICKVLYEVVGTPVVYVVVAAVRKSEARHAEVLGNSLA